MDVEVTIRSGRKVLERTTMPLELVDTHLAVAAYMYGGVSGSVGWRHPVSGQPLARPRATIKPVK